MKLRSQLLLGSSALIALALLGLLLGLLGVLQLAYTQSQLTTRNLSIVEASLGMHQEMGTQVTLMLADRLDHPALKASARRFREWLDKAGESAADAADRQALGEIERVYGRFDQLLQNPMTVRRSLLESDDFGRALEALRNRINAAQQRYITAVEQSEAESRRRARLIGGLLGLVGLAVLLIGFLTASTIAQRFGAPIEALARAAAQIGRGDYQVKLPRSPVAELAALSRSFGLMANALGQLKATNLEALVASQRRLQAVFDSIDDGLLICDRQGRVEHLSPVARRQLAWGDERLGQTLGEALQRPELDEQLRLVLHGGSLEQAPDDLVVEVGGETRLLSYYLTPVSHSEGHILGAVMVLHEVTEQRAFEQVRNEFVLRASHELRTPMTSMHMAFGLLRERLQFPDESREADLLRTLGEEMQRLVRLIDDLLNFSRYQSGQQKLELAPCDLKELLRRVQERFAAQAASRAIALECELQTPLPHLNLDHLQIERVLDNLLGNALRHTPGGGQIRLQARRQGQRVILSVEDNGEGIPYGQQARIFEPFVQVGSHKEGAGLGLALCREIVQLHGGHIGVYSRPGQGSTFYLTLPV